MLRSIVALAGTLLLAACGSRDAPDGRARVEREVRGDTTVVRTLAGQAWEAPRQAVVDLSIGSLEGPEETMFGSIQALAPDGRGGVYVYDGQAPAIRHFDANGTFVRQIGREGQGPGEYQDAVLGMAVRRDGRLQIRDARNGRVTLYHPDGSYSDQWPVASGLFTSDAMFLDDRDHTYLKVLQEQPQTGQPWRVGLLHLDQDGAIVDTVPDPEVQDPPPAGGGAFSPSKVWTFTGQGAVVVGVSDRYRFDVRRRDGSVLRVERAADPVPVLDGEHAAYEARRVWTIERRGQFLTTLPGPTARSKPFYRGLYSDGQGRIWVWIHAPAQERDVVEPAGEDAPPPIPYFEPRIFDVFEADGAHLGQVHVPRGINILHFGTDVLWGVRTGDLGERYVVRLRLEPHRGENGTP